MTKFLKIISFMLLTILILIMSGCVENTTDTAHKLSSELNILNWEDYFYPTIVEDFQEKYNVTLNIYTFDEEDYMISELETNPGSFDFVIASDAIVRELIAAKALAELNKNNIPNMNNINSDFLDKSFDPNNTYSLPYLWGTTGIAYNSSIISEDITSWLNIWNNSTNQQIAMIDNNEEVIGAVLKYLGYGISPENISQLNNAETFLISNRDTIKGFYGSKEIVNGLISGNISLAQSYSGDSLFAAERNEDIVYIIPDEGAAIWIDSMMIPVDSQHKYTAEVFMNYLLEPEISAAITNYQWYANPNTAANIYINEEILQDTSIYPSEEILDKCEFFNKLTPEVATDMNRIWSELKNN